MTSFMHSILTALAKLRDPKLDSARAGLPVTVAEAVALVDAFGGAFTMAGAAECVGLQCHQPLRGEADPWCVLGSELRFATQFSTQAQRGDRRSRSKLASEDFSRRS